MIKKIIFTLIIFLFIGCSAKVVNEKESLKIISYNIYVGMQKDTTANKLLFAEWIKGQDPDILAIQEANGFTQKSLKAFAESYSHPYAILIKEWGYPVAITSKYPIVNVEKVLDNMTHGFIKARIKGHNFIVTHLHPNSYIERNREVDLITETIKYSRDDTKWIVMGDFNSISPADKSHYDNSPQYLEQMKQLAIQRPHSINLKNDSLYYGVIGKILDFGLLDPLKEKSEKYISSCPTKIEYDQISEEASARYDYIFLSKDLMNNVKSISIAKDNFTHYYSDHYPVILEVVY